MISKIELIDQLATLPSHVWQSAKEISSDNEIAWVSLFVPDKEVGPAIGMTSKADWVAVGNAGLDQLDPDKLSPVWLLVLQHPLSEIRQQLRAKSKEFNLKHDFSDFLPYESIILVGLNYGNDPGMAFAIDWLEEDSGLVGQKVKDQLQRISGEKSFSQKLRHRAAKLAGPNLGSRRH